MPIEKPRARRYPLTANVELTDIDTERVIHERISNLSLFGCQVQSQNPFPAGTRVRVKILHKGSTFSVMALVASVRGTVMGVEFTKIEDRQQTVLEQWMAELREHSSE